MNCQKWVVMWSMTLKAPTLREEESRLDLKLDPLGIWMERNFPFWLGVISLLVDSRLVSRDDELCILAVFLKEMLFTVLKYSNRLSSGLV